MHTLREGKAYEESLARSLLLLNGFSRHTVPQPSDKRYRSLTVNQTEHSTLGFSQSVKTLIATAVAPIATASALIGCMAQPPEDRKQQQLTISAAASLQNALTEITPLFEKAYPNTEIFYNWGGSGTLQRQIEQGAPADIFFPASTQQMALLAQKNLVLTHPPKANPQLLSNELVLIAPLNSSLTGFEDLMASPVNPAEAKQSQAATRPASKPVKQLAVGEFQSVPAGQYAQATLKRLNLLPQLTSKLVFFSNVRGVLAAVENGHAEAGLVYRTDAELSERVKIIAIAPPQTHPPIHYPVAILQRAEEPEAAQAYIDFLSTPAAQQIFEQFGFTTPKSPMDSAILSIGVPEKVH